MDDFARKPDAERKDVLQESANRMDLAEIILEKDFWVCWTLKRLFSNPEIAQHLTFKGGTSLSKGYGAIARFSEDIDLTINRNAPFLSDGANPLESDISTNERKRRLDALKSNAQRFIAELVEPQLTKNISAALGTNEGWEISLDNDDPDGQTLLFHYPRVFDYQIFVPSVTRPMSYPISSPISQPIVRGDKQDHYIKPQIKLEFGARGDTSPNETRSIKPYAADIFPDLFKNPSCEVSMLGAERTFWEKATILHSLHHGVTLKDRMSRHYYDTFMLQQKGIADKAIQNPSLLEQVVLNKSLMFKDNKASYDTAVIGSLKLLPNKDQIKILKDDYKKMEEMFMSEHPRFDEIIDALGTLEQKINK